jgi:putative transcription factor
MVISECNVCGSDATRKAKIEGTIVDVCDKCVRFGDEVREVEFRKPKKVTVIEETEQVLAKDFSKSIRKAREDKKLTQEDFAKKLNEKVSIIKRIEEGWQPSDRLVKKIEKFFNIKLKEDAVQLAKEKRTTKKKLTIGDVVEIG